MKLDLHGRPAGPLRIPRPFKLHWGAGVVAEEAQISTRYHDPTLQLLRFESGLRQVRFCVYRDGGFSRMPLIVGVEDIRRLGRALADCPELLAAFEQLVSAARKSRRPPPVT